MSTLAHRTPGGAQTRSKQHAVFGGPPFPQTLAEVHGAYTWDDAGRKYIDWMSALASVGLGHGHPDVTFAVEQAIRLGHSLSLPSRLEYEVADQLCEALKWPDQVRWVKTGSEATAAAMMIARRATGRKKIVSIGYHGWHECHSPSEYLVDVPWGTGHPRYETEGPLTRVVDATVAAVLLEPMRDYEQTHHGVPVGQYVRDIQLLCRMHGALLILDEMVTGFRWAIGGASEYLGIQPDLACYGKAMANGYPLACVVGSKRLMKHAHDVSSTFGGELVGLAAAKATLEVYRKEPVIERLWEVGRRLMAGVPELRGYPVHPVLEGTKDWTSSESNIPVVQALAQRGHLVHPAGINVTYAHTDADADQLVTSMNEVLRDIRG